MGRVVWILVLAALAGCYGGYRGTFGKGAKKNSGLKPAAVEPAAQARPARQGPLRVIELKVYADPAYQREAPRWRERFRMTVLRANRILGPLLELELKVVTTGTWPRKASPDDRGALLDELVALDAGGQLTWVVGLAPSLPKVAVSFDEYGAAVLGGRHLFVRSVDDLDEYNALRTVRDDLSPEKREKIYQERKRHRELVVFLHELGHTFGVEHHDDPDGIMHDGYRTSMNGFLPASAATMRGELVRELAGDRGELADRRAEEARAEAMSRAQAAIREATRSVDVDQVRLHLQQAELALVELGDGVEPLWDKVARAYRELNLVTLCAQALARTGEQPSPDLAAWVTRMRVRYAIPANAVELGLSPSSEPDYIASINAIMIEIGKGDTDAARRAIRAGAKAHGDLPGYDVMRCDLAARAEQWKRARTLCERAIARADNASWAHFLAGAVARRGKRTDDARRHLERALELDPTLDAARRELSRLR